MIRKLEQSNQNIIGIAVNGKLTKEDYEWFSPYLTDTVDTFKHASILVEMDDFHGWQPRAAWEDMKLYGFDINKKIDKIAMVGDKNWEKWMVTMTKPFVFAEMQYFDKVDEALAWEWVEASI